MKKIKIQNVNAKFVTPNCYIKLSRWYIYNSKLFVKFQISCKIWTCRTRKQFTGEKINNDELFLRWNWFPKNVLIIETENIKTWNSNLIRTIWDFDFRLLVMLLLAHITVELDTHQLHHKQSLSMDWALGTIFYFSVWHNVFGSDFPVHNWSTTFLSTTYKLNCPQIAGFRQNENEKWPDLNPFDLLEK